MTDRMTGCLVRSFDGQKFELFLLEVNSPQGPESVLACQQLLLKCGLQFLPSPANVPDFTVRRVAVRQQRLICITGCTCL